MTSHFPLDHQAFVELISPGAGKSPSFSCCVPGGLDPILDSLEYTLRFRGTVMDHLVFNLAKLGTVIIVTLPILYFTRFLKPVVGRPSKEGLFLVEHPLHSLFLMICSIFFFVSAGYDILEWIHQDTTSLEERLDARNLSILIGGLIWCYLYRLFHHAAPASREENPDGPEPSRRHER